eukprot:2472585-Prymnesium_polylepis.2
MQAASAQAAYGGGFGGGLIGGGAGGRGGTSLVRASEEALQVVRRGVGRIGLGHDYGHARYAGIARPLALVHRCHGQGRRKADVEPFIPARRSRRHLPFLHRAGGVEAHRRVAVGARGSLLEGERRTAVAAN